MLRGNAGEEWERFGRADPYYGVWAIEEMRGRRPGDEMRARFFASGEEHISGVLARLREVAGADFRAERVLDFGCGVGRLLIPLARGARRAVGVDVSPSMLAEARRNCDELGVHVELICPNELAHLEPEFDLVHSALVLQHMPVRAGEHMLGRLAGLLRPGGAGAVQVTVAAAPHLLAYNALMKLPLSHNILNIVRGRPWDYPHMQMNVYDLTRLVRLLRDRGIPTVHVRTEERTLGYDSCEMIFQRTGR